MTKAGLAKSHRNTLYKSYSKIYIIMMGSTFMCLYHYMPVSVIFLASELVNIGWTKKKLFFYSL